MNMEKYQKKIDKIKRMINLIEELDLTDSRKIIIEKHYPLFDMCKKKCNTFKALEDYIIIRLKRSNRDSDIENEIRKFYNFQLEYVSDVK